MVARPEPGGDAAGIAEEVASGLFARWRAWVSAALAQVSRAPFGRAVAGARVAGTALGRALRSPGTASSPAERRALAVAGIAALAAGCALSLALARPLGLTPVEAAIGAAWTLAWVLARLAILRLACPRVPAGALGVAWAGGLLPAALAFADAPRLLALAASAWLTAATLRAAGVARGEAWRAVGWAFGAEALATAARWIASGVLLYLAVR